MPPIIELFNGIPARGEAKLRPKSPPQFRWTTISRPRWRKRSRNAGQGSDQDSVDPNLLGGLIVKMGSRMIDSSLRTKLNNLKLAMKGVG